MSTVPWLFYVDCFLFCKGISEYCIRALIETFQKEGKNLRPVLTVEPSHTDNSLPIQLSNCSFTTNHFLWFRQGCKKGGKYDLLPYPLDPHPHQVLVKCSWFMIHGSTDNIWFTLFCRECTFWGALLAKIWWEGARKPTACWPIRICTFSIYMETPPPTLDVRAIFQQNIL